jgi:hypothetical protein
MKCVSISVPKRVPMECVSISGCQCVNRCVLMYRDVLRPVWRASSSFAASAKLLGISNALVRFVIWPRSSGAPEICEIAPKAAYLTDACLRSDSVLMAAVAWSRMAQFCLSALALTRSGNATGNTTFQLIPIPHCPPICCRHLLIPARAKVASIVT